MKVEHKKTNMIYAMKIIKKEIFASDDAGERDEVGFCNAARHLLL